MSRKRVHELDLSTRLIHFEASPGDPHHPVSTPIYQTATFAQGEGVGHDYTRSGNPTRAVLEGQLARLEGGAHAFAFTSGMAALAAVARLVSCGGEIVAGSDLYGGTYRLLSKVLARHGVTVRYVDTTDLQAVADALGPKTELVLVETPTNPLQRITDLRSLAALCRDAGVRLAVDNTVMSPVLQRPLQLGADLVIHSATKFLGGHSDVSAGVVVVADPGLAEALYFTQNAEGAGLAPFDAWLVLRGTKTLKLRVREQQHNAAHIARWLLEQPDVTQVHWPGLSDHPGHAVHAAQADGFGSLISFETGSADHSRAVVEGTSLFTTAVSFGGVGSSIGLPCAMSHASIPAASRALPEDLVRVSVGIEDVGDLIDDLECAFAHSRRSGPAKWRAEVRRSA